MIKLIIFDVDNTLAEPNMPVKVNIVNAIKEIESKGIKIALISGKPTAYLCGFARQIGLKNPVLSGENGAHIYYSAKFPPERDLLVSKRQNRHQQIMKKLQASVMKKFGQRVWMQPNLINLSFFPKSKKVMKELITYITDYASERKGFNKLFRIYKHADAIELVPVTVNKGKVLRKIKTMEKIKKDEVIAVGDGENDLPMFEEAGISIGINLKNADYNFKNIEQAIKYVKSKVNAKK